MPSMTKADIHKAWRNRIANRAAEMDTALSVMTDVMNSLDVSASICRCCGSKTYNNWPDKLLYDHLFRITRELRALIR